MNKIKYDKFITNLLGIRSYFYVNDVKKINKNLIKGLKKPFFLTIKSRHSLNTKQKKYFSARFICKQYLFSMRLNHKNLNSNHCYLENGKFKKNVIKISLEKSSNSHYVQDKKLPLNFRNKLRFNWVKNFYKGLRGNHLVVYKKKFVAGFLLLIKKKENLIIDLIVTKRSQVKKGIGKSLINFVCSNFSNKKKLILAGTQSNNYAAFKFYKKIGFKRTNKDYYIYHVLMK